LSAAIGISFSILLVSKNRTGIKIQRLRPSCNRDNLDFEIKNKKNRIGIVYNLINAIDERANIPNVFLNPGLSR
jgi:hypothetical protein